MGDFMPMGPGERFEAARQGHADADTALMQGYYQQQVSQTNARLAKIQGQDAIKKGNLAADETRRSTDRAVGEQTASYAAQGVDTGSGSAADVAEETRLTGELNARSIQNSAWRQAWGHEVEAQQHRDEAEWAEFGAKRTAKAKTLEGNLKATRIFR